MDIIDKIKNYLVECKNDDNLKNKSDSKLIELFFTYNNLNIPDNIQKLLCLDHLFFEKTINNIEIYKWLKESNYYDELSGKITYSPIIDNKQIEWEEIEILITKKDNQLINKNKYYNFELKQTINYCEKMLFGT